MSSSVPRLSPTPKLLENQQMLPSGPAPKRAAHRAGGPGIGIASGMPHAASPGEREFRGFLECGILAHGFLRVHCDACGRDRLVALSCKGRGFCPSCLGRRMADTAAHLVDRVLPEAPVRQWVLTLPFALRYRLAYDAALTSVVLREFIRRVFASYRRRARQRGPIRRPRGGAVTFINNPRDFRVVRFARDSKGRLHGHWIPMSKGIGNLRRYLQIGGAANRRYLDALAAAKPVRHTLADLDTLCTGRVVNGNRCPRLNPVAPSEHRIFQAVMAGEHAINGFRNRDLQARLYSAPANSALELKTRCARVSRIIAKLRGHGLVAKVPGSRLYRVTERGHRVMGLAIRFRLLDFPQALAA